MNHKIILIAMILLFFTTQAFALNKENLVAYYDFNNATGNILTDIFNYDNNGANTNTSVSPQGILGNAYYFNNNAYSALTNTGFSTGSFTIALWVKTNAVGVNDVIYSQGTRAVNGVTIENEDADPNHEFYGFVRNVRSYSGYDISDGNAWNLIIVDYNGAGYSSLINNSVFNSAGVSGAINIATPKIGTLGTEYYLGLADEMSVWSRVLTPTEKAELYNSGSAVTLCPARAFYTNDQNFAAVCTYTPIATLDANFSYSINKVTQKIDFNDTTIVVGTAINDWNWLIDGISRSTDQNFSYSTSPLIDVNACLIVHDTTYSLSSTECLKFNTGDWNAPTTTFSYTQYTDETKAKLTFTCTDNNSGCKYLTYNINNSGWISVSNTGVKDINYSGTGDHNVLFYSSDNSDNNESTKTGLFTTTGFLRIHTYDENTLAAFAGNINFNGTDYNATSSETIDLNGIASGSYTIAFTYPGYGTRYWIGTISEFLDLNLNLLMLPTTQGVDLQYTLFQPDQLTPYANAKVNIYKPNKNNYTIGVYYSDAFGHMNVFTNLFDQNYLFEINDGEETYQPVALTIKFPLDEATSLAIPTNYTINITGAGAQDFNDVATDKVVYLLPNTIPLYKITIQDVNENYFPRSYYRSYQGNPLTDTLQPYLISALTGLLATIRSVSGSTNQPIPNVNVKIYKDLPIGRTLVEDITTDAKGEALAYTITGDQYYFGIYYNGILVRTDTILATSSVVYIRLDDLIYTQPVLGDISAGVNFYPAYMALSLADKKLIQIITINDANSTTTISNILINVWNTDRNGVSGSSVKVYSNYITYADQNSITNTIDLNANIQKIQTTWYDTNGYLQVEVILITNDGNFSTFFSYKPWTGINPIYSIGFGSRSLFACSSYYDQYGNPNPLIPCGGQLFFALFVSFILTAATSFSLKFQNPAGLGLIFMLIMGVFAYLTFVPIVLYGIMVAGLFVVIFVAKGRFN